MRLTKYNHPLLRQIRRTDFRIKELAQLCKISESSLYALLRGERRYSLEDTYNLTEVLGCTLEEILNYSPDVEDDVEDEDAEEEPKDE